MGCHCNYISTSRDPQSSESVTTKDPSYLTRDFLISLMTPQRYLYGGITSFISSSGSILICVQCSLECPKISRLPLFFSTRSSLLVVQDRFTCFRSSDYLSLFVHRWFRSSVVCLFSVTGTPMSSVVMIPTSGAERDK